MQGCNLDFRLKCIVGLNAYRWAQFFCSFVVSYIPICISYKKLGSDWSTVKHCFLDSFHYIVLKKSFVGHAWYQNKEIHFRWEGEFANQFIVICLINQENLTAPCKSIIFPVISLNMSFLVVELWDMGTNWPWCTVQLWSHWRLSC